ncbi:DUF2569 domain-containing protein [Bradyrhizobium sp. LHD-71]|uniref:DUF2569 domain-containing protein n=1 Tax=Bradyrhizobium sp. LHD-71 TaxID=3072141 RepID=UPI00280F169D|nr:DUF2569 domain-containing protein [Bradyrhizobium sp. LHD-71]MDQ8726359.1 DUF2569 domain-containing protein [Bradyrhizobium sp. LHD-71]
MSELQSADAPAVPWSASGSAAAELRGIGGWLLVAALAQLFGPLRLLILLGRDYLNPENKEALEQFPIAGYGEFALNVMLLLLMTVTAVLFFLTSRHFPRFFICTLITVVIFPVLTSAWLAFALSVQLDEPFGDHFVFEGQDVAQIGFAAIWALIWIPYTLRSKRVKNTFGAPALAAEEATGPVS